MPTLSSILSALNIELTSYEGDALICQTPVDGSTITSLRMHSSEEVESTVSTSVDAFYAWREVPTPKRGELVRLFGEVLRENKESLSQLVTLECGKILEEARGEVQEMIDICDFAVGLSRQLYGLTIASERHEHNMYETWYPIGPVLIISAFNFPVAVWSWNMALALVCGDSIIWKPSEKTPLTAIACQTLLERTIEAYNKQEGNLAPTGLSQLLIGDANMGDTLVKDSRIGLVSATGSSRMGQIVAPKVAERFGRSLLELGGNNAVIISDKADLSVAMPSVIFGAVGTAGQRCTSTRRAFIHRSHYDACCKQIQQAYEALIQKSIGSPLDDSTLIGPLIDEVSYKAMQDALVQAKTEGGQVHFGSRALADTYPDGYYVEPALVMMNSQTPIVLQETFAPILYTIPYDTLEEALKMNNAALQGLSSAIFTTDMREAAYFTRHSDCGIANVNIGTSGAEIGGAFGGEKETGGGRESGSDAWKVYMRRQTSTQYYGMDAPALAQGVTFDVS